MDTTLVLTQANAFLAFVDLGAGRDGDEDHAGPRLSRCNYVARWTSAVGGLSALGSAARTCPALTDAADVVQSIRRAPLLHTVPPHDKRSVLIMEWALSRGEDAEA